MNDCRCHSGSAISQHGDRAASRCLPACLSLRHLLSIPVQGRIVPRIFSAADFCAGRRIFSDLCELPADFSVAYFRGGFLRRSESILRRILWWIFGGFLSGPKPCKLQIKIAESCSPKIHRILHRMLAVVNITLSPYSSPHASPADFCELQSDFVADFFRGVFCESLADFFMADFHGGFPRRIFVRHCARIPH